MFGEQLYLTIAVIGGDITNFTLFKNRNYALLITSEATSLFGTLFLNIALSLYVLKLTGSAEQFATVLGVGVVPTIVLGPISGALSDRFDRTKWIVALDISRGLLCMAMFSYSFDWTFHLPLIYFTVFFLSACDILFAPAFISIMPLIVKPEQLVEANTFERTMNETMKIFAPFLGTLVYSLVGLGPVLLVDGLSFFISAVALRSIVMEKRDPGTMRQIRFFQDVIGGFKVFLVDKRLTSVVGNAFLTNTFMYPFILLGFPYMIVTVLGGKGTEYGLVESISTIGSISAISVVPLMKRFGVAKNIGIGILGMCVPVVLLLFLASPKFLAFLKGAHYLPVIFFGLVSFVLFLSFSFYVVFFASFYQTTVPKEMYSRFVAGALVMNAIGKLIGYKVFGYLFSLDNLLYAVIALGIGMLLKLLVHVPFVRITNQIEKQQQHTHTAYTGTTNDVH
ncbi:MFS transporter [Alicyclobacillus fodiniaquatilis]|uniref:MFS transporter n=1 Tax=Alicyclobacillus fodiniaquatilis TaxID=1661150 RepID=A0ABW4JKS4_9BACL